MTPTPTPAPAPGRSPLAWRVAGGLLVGAAPGIVLALVARLVNPWFLDRPGLYALVVLLGPCFVGAALAIRRATAPRRAPMALAAAVAVYALTSLWPVPRLRDVELLVMGWDGATFDIVDPMIAGGELEALEALMARGTRAVLRGEEPLHSAILWTTIATGRPADDHGVSGFGMRASACRVPRLWDVAEAEGRRVGVYKWLVTYPPRRTTGFMVPAWLADGPETWPRELSFVKELELSRRVRRTSVQAERGSLRLAVCGIPRGLRFGTLLEAAGWQLQAWLAEPDEDERFIAGQRLRARIDRDVFVRAVHEHRPQLATFTFYGTDALAHRYWGEDLPGGARVLEDAYWQADSILAELLDLLPHDSTVVVVSDHGFTSLSDGDANPYKQPLTRRLQLRLSAELGPVEVVRIGAQLAVTLTEDRQQPGDLTAVLERLTDDTGEPFYRWETQPGTGRALGLVIRRDRLREADIDRGRVGGEPMADYVTLERRFSGQHEADGILVAAGPGVPVGGEPGVATHLDVAPTLQALLGIAPARDLPGRILFGPDQRGRDTRDPLVHGIELMTAAPPDHEDVLRALGYVD